MSRILKNSRILTIILVLILILAFHIQFWYCFDLEKTKSISWFWYWLLTCHLDDFWYWINIVFSISRLLILILGNNFRRQVNIDFDIAWHFSSMECWYWYCRVKPDLAHPCPRVGRSLNPTLGFLLVLVGFSQGPGRDLVSCMLLPVFYFLWKKSGKFKIENKGGTVSPSW